MSRVLKLIEELDELYRKYLDLINDEYFEDKNISDYLGDINNIDELLMEFYDTVKEIEDEEIKIIKRDEAIIASVIRQLNDDINSTSIVDLINTDFESKSNNGQSKSILLTGDITKTVYENILSDDIDNVDLLKAPHHGTNDKKHYSNDLPQAKIILISNGKYKNRDIVDGYERYIIDGNIKCTNGQSTCKIQNNNGGSCPRNCDCLQKEIICNI